MGNIFFCQPSVPNFIISKPNTNWSLQVGNPGYYGTHIVHAVTDSTNTYQRCSFTESNKPGYFYWRLNCHPAPQ